MKLKLRVLDPKAKKLPTIENDDRWNCEKEFEVPERLILKLAEEILEELEEDQFYVIEAIKYSDKKSIPFNEIEKLVRPTRTWKKIHVMISDQGFETSRFTRISLFEELIDTKKMKLAIKDRVHDIEKEKAGTKIPEEKSQPQLAPITQAPKIHESIFTEFMNKIN